MKAEDTLKIKKRNLFSNWNEKEDISSRRLYKGNFCPNISPKFLLDGKLNIFAIGSCFARRIEDAFVAKGQNVLSYTKEFNKYMKINSTEQHRGILNKYHTFSILNDLEWALNKQFDYDDFVEYSAGQWVDLYSHDKILEMADKEITTERRKIINSINAKVKDANVVFITLGLIEAWYDNEVEKYINVVPSPRLIKKFPNRFAFKIISYEDNMRNLEKVYKLIQDHNIKDYKIIVSVSPVPLNTTFRNQDVVSANTFSKSMLRAIAEEWALKHENIDYFPSYEMALFSQFENVWRNDGRHVRDSFADFIIDNFMQAYTGKNQI